MDQQVSVNRDDSVVFTFGQAELQISWPQNIRKSGDFWRSWHEIIIEQVHTNFFLRNLYHIRGQFGDKSQ
jgi:hypothetical protein